MIRTLSFITSHPLTRDRPLAAIARFARWQIESRLKQDVEFDWIDGAKLIVRNGMTGATGNIYCGLHEFADMGFLLHFLRPGDLFVDVGANIGSYTVLASKVCGATTIAVEPDPETMAFLKRNVEANDIGRLTTLIEAAVGAQTGTAEFTVGLDTINHLATGTEEKTRVVQMRTLDEILGDRDPVMIKLDVEGFEPDVVAGAGETLKNASLLALQTESRSLDVIGPLKAAGFEEAHYEPFLKRLSDTSVYGESNALLIRNADQCQKRLTHSVDRSLFGRRL